MRWCCSGVDGAIPSRSSSQGDLIARKKKKQVFGGDPPPPHPLMAVHLFWRFNDGSFNALAVGESARVTRAHQQKGGPILWPCAAGLLHAWCRRVGALPTRGADIRELRCRQRSSSTQ